MGLLITNRFGEYQYPFKFALLFSGKSGWGGFDHGFFQNRKSA
jgi:hypothetical protein